MSYTPIIEGFEGQNIEVKTSFWTGPKLLVNGEPAVKGARRGELLLQRNDSRQVTAAWKQQGLGVDVPQLIVDGKVINLVEPLKWYQWVWGGLPIALIFIGGMLGGLVGVIGFSINARIFRASMNEVVKYLVTGAITLVTVVAYFIAALIFTFLINQ